MFCVIVFIREQRCFNEVSIAARQHASKDNIAFVLSDSTGTDTIWLFHRAVAGGQNGESGVSKSSFFACLRWESSLMLIITLRVWNIGRAITSYDIRPTSSTAF